MYLLIETETICFVLKTNLYIHKQTEKKLIDIKKKSIVEIFDNYPIGIVIIIIISESIPRLGCSTSSMSKPRFRNYEFLISLPDFSILNMTHQNELITTYFNYNSFSLRKISGLRNRPSTEKSF
jgi:hypothetical protein